MKTTTLTIALLVTLIAPSLKASEGLDKGLSKKELAEVLPWAKNVQMTLKEALDNVSKIENYREAEEKLLREIKLAYSETGKSYAKSLTRFALNRGLDLYEMINKVKDGHKIFMPHLKLLILKVTAQNALLMTDKDINFIDGKIPNLDYAALAGVTLAQGIVIADNVITPKIRYHIIRSHLLFVQHDLYSSSERQSFARKIKKIQDLVKIYPAQISDYFKRYKASNEMRKLMDEIGIPFFP